MKLPAVALLALVLASYGLAKDGPHEGRAPVATTGADAKVDLNTAPEDVLMKLPGVTEKGVKAIVAGRCYKSAADLVDRKIVTSATYEKVKDLVAASECKPKPSAPNPKGAAK